MSLRALPVRKARQCGVSEWWIPESAQFPADIEEFLPPLLANRIRVEVAQIVKRLGDGFSSGRDHGRGITMGTADRLLQDLVNDAEAQHVLGGDLHAVGGFLGLGAVAQ